MGNEQDTKTVNDCQSAGVVVRHFIKSQRLEFELKNGDILMDNGACYQLLTRKTYKGWRTIYPEVSKKEFKKYISLPNVKEYKKHLYGKSVHLYKYYA